MSRRPCPKQLDSRGRDRLVAVRLAICCSGKASSRYTCAGYLGHLFAELDVLCFIERAFLSKHTIGTYNHYGLESLAVLSFCLR